MFDQVFFHLNFYIKIKFVIPANHWKISLKINIVHT